MGSASWDLDGVAAEFTAAALKPARWKTALQRLSETVGAVGKVLLPPVAQRLEAMSTDSLVGVSEHYIKERWYTRDSGDRGTRKLLQGGVAVDLDLRPAAQALCPAARATQEQGRSVESTS